MDIKQILHFVTRKPLARDTFCLILNMVSLLRQISLVKLYVKFNSNCERTCASKSEIFYFNARLMQLITDDEDGINGDETGDLDEFVVG